MPDDFETLRNAFAELERRADTAADPAPPLVRHRYRHRPVLIAASVVGVAAVATGTALLAGGSDSPDRAPAAGASPSAAASAQPTPSPVPPSPTAPSSSAPSGPVASEPTGSTAVPSSSAPSGPVASELTGSTAAPSSSVPTGSGDHFRVPQTAQELARRFRHVLAGTATIDFQDLGGGAVIVGTITTSDGVTGGFDLQIFRTEPGSRAQCEDPGLAVCSVHRLDDGSSLALGHEPDGPGAVTYQADLVRADGVDLHMHVSNERDPKGGSEVLSPHPPLSLDDMSALLRSDRW